MPLRLQQTELGSPIHKDAVDFAVFSGDWAMGRIYQFHGGPEPMRWSWSLYGILGKPQGLRSDGRAPDFVEARIIATAADVPLDGHARSADSP
jgi:hypothetical protein